MKTRIFYTVIAVAVLIGSGCGKEDIVTLKASGYLRPELVIPKVDNLTGKDVPECTGVEPVAVVYALTGQYGTFRDTAAISIAGNTFAVLEPLEYPEGQYSIDEVFLVDELGNTLYSVPSVTEPDFIFSVFVERPLPYVITIPPGETVSTYDEVLCYREQVADFGSELDGSGEIAEVVSIYFYLPPGSCIELVTLEVDAYRIIEWPVYEFGVQRLYIPKEFGQFALRAYLDDADPGNPVQSITGTSHDPSEVYLFDLNCP